MSQSFHDDYVAKPIPPEPDMEDIPFDDNVKEQKFHQAWFQLTTEPDPRSKPNWFGAMILLGVIAYVLFLEGKLDLFHGLVTLGVLLFHDLGHLLGMKLFGFVDTRYFFFPFLSPLLRFNQHTASANKQIITYLLGPLPGILIASVYYLLFRTEISSEGMYVFWFMLIFNALTLLPFEHWDGGKILQLCVTTRNAWVEIFFAGLALVGVVLLALNLAFQQSLYLYIYAGFLLIALPFRFRKALMAERLRREGVELPWKLTELKAIQARMLFLAAADVYPAVADQPKVMAQFMRELHDRTLVPPPSWLATILHLVVYVIIWVLVLFMLSLWYVDLRDLRMQTFIHVKDINQLDGRIRSLKRKMDKQEPEEKAKTQKEVTDLETKRATAKATFNLLQDKIDNLQFPVLNRRNKGKDQNEDFDP